MTDEKKKPEGKEEKKPAAPPKKEGGGKKAKGGAGQLFEVAGPNDPVANRVPRIKKMYEEKVVPTLVKKLGLKNPCPVIMLIQLLP